MKNLETLQTRVEKMINDEKKRRQVAIEWLERVTEALTEPCVEVLGDMGTYVGYDVFAVSIWDTNPAGEKQYKNVYFRYENGIGFYIDNESDELLQFGEPLENIKGANFWAALKKIINWLPLIEADLEKRSNSRQLIIEKLLV